MPRPRAFQDLDIDVDKSTAASLTRDNHYANREVMDLHETNLLLADYCYWLLMRIDVSSSVVFNCGLHRGQTKNI